MGYFDKKQSCWQKRLLEFNLTGASSSQYKLQETIMYDLKLIVSPWDLNPVSSRITHWHPVSHEAVQGAGSTVIKDSWSFWSYDCWCVTDCLCWQVISPMFFTLTTPTTIHFFLYIWWKIKKSLDSVYKTGNTFSFSLLGILECKGNKKSFKGVRYTNFKNALKV